DSDKDGIMRNYFDAYLRYRNGEQIGDYNAFRLGYFNSTIHRALSLCSSWSSPGREDMASKRELLIRNALNSIERIKEESPEYYLRYRENYHNLTSALLDFRSLIVEHEN
ncbi:MAG: hypothetical protein NT001_05500, partial [Candidatus Woesearchaeota archaeon]|nr:hypothetical protein [Candidatus Woesearchaeota archaeon]